MLTLRLSFMYELREYQKEAVAAGLSHSNGIIVASTGSGKSLIVAGLVLGSAGKTLVLQPTKEILEQNLAKIKAFGFEDVGIYSASVGIKEVGQCTYATIGSIINCLEKFVDTETLIIDECFVAGTLVDGAPIECYRPGDRITTFDCKSNSVCESKVVAVSKRIAPDFLCRIVIDGKETISTLNHPFFVEERGYVPAFLLNEGDYVVSNSLESNRAESLARIALHTLRFADEIQGFAPLFSLPENRNGFSQNLRFKIQRPIIFKTHDIEESYAKCSYSIENFENFEAHRAQASISRRKRNTYAKASKDAVESFRKKLVCGISSANEKASRLRLSDLLQDRHCKPDEKISSRDRRQQPLCFGSEEERRQKDGVVGFVRVESAEVFEQGSAKRDGKSRQFDFVYNLEIEKYHNYFANGVLVHNCHLVSSKGGQYEQLIKTLKPKRLIGLTATPYRLHTTRFGSDARILSRTRPKLFDKIIHVTQTADLIKQGFLVQPEYVVSGKDTDKILQLNSSGAEYTEESIAAYLKATDAVGRSVDAAQEAIQAGRKHILIFTPFVADAAKVAVELNNLGIRAAMISGDTAKSEREFCLQKFQSGEVKVVVNAQVLLIGYDFPALDCVVDSSPTMSLSRYYQKIGRGVRPHPDKDKIVVYDLVDNFSRFDDPMNYWVIESSPGLHAVLSKTGRLTNRIIGSGPEMNDKIEFGKYKRAPLCELPDSYLSWYVETAKKSATWHSFRFEQIRRKIFFEKAH